MDNLGKTKCDAPAADPTGSQDSRSPKQLLLWFCIWWTCPRWYMFWNFQSKMTIKKKKKVLYQKNPKKLPPQKNLHQT